MHLKENHLISRHYVIQFSDHESDFFLSVWFVSGRIFVLEEWAVGLCLWGFGREGGG